MDKKFVLLIIALALIFLEVYFKIFSTIITGFSVIFLSIAQEMRVCLEFLDMPTQVVQFTTTNVRVGLWNCGSVELNDTTIQLEVKDINNNTASLTERVVLDISFDERMEVTIPWYANPSPGLYTMYVRAIYDNESSNEIISKFSIIPPPYVPPRLPYVPPTRVKVANISVNYPPRLNLTTDAEYIVLFKIDNTGNLVIHNLTLDLESPYIEVEVVYPDIVSVLEVEESIIFTVRLKVPEEIDPGNYSIYWFVSSDEIDKAGVIIGEVRILDIREKAKELLAYYTEILERLGAEINIAERDGKNITAARNVLEEAKTELNIAKEFFKIGLYTESIEQLFLVREKIIEAVKLLVLAKPVTRIIFPALPIIPCVIWVIIVIIVNSMIALSMIRRWHWVKIVLIMIIVSFVIGLLSGLDCAIWIIVTVLIMIAIFILIVLGERLKKESSDLARFRRW